MSTESTRQGPSKPPKVEEPIDNEQNEQRGNKGEENSEGAWNNFGREILNIPPFSKGDAREKKEEEQARLDQESAEVEEPERERTISSLIAEKRQKVREFREKYQWDTDPNADLSFLGKRKKKEKAEKELHILNQEIMGLQKERMYKMLEGSKNRNSFQEPWSSRFSDLSDRKSIIDNLTSKKRYDKVSEGWMTRGTSVWNSSKNRFMKKTEGGMVRKTIDTTVGAAGIVLSAPKKMLDMFFPTLGKKSRWTLMLALGGGVAYAATGPMAAGVRIASGVAGMGLATASTRRYEKKIAVVEQKIKEENQNIEKAVALKKELLSLRKWQTFYAIGAGALSAIGAWNAASLWENHGSPVMENIDGAIETTRDLHQSAVDVSVKGLETSDEWWAQERQDFSEGLDQFGEKVQPVAEWVEEVVDDAKEEYARTGSLWDTPGALFNRWEAENRMEEWKEVQERLKDLPAKQAVAPVENAASAGSESDRGEATNNVSNSVSTSTPYSGNDSFISQEDTQRSSDTADVPLNTNTVEIENINDVRELSSEDSQLETVVNPEALENNSDNIDEQTVPGDLVIGTYEYTEYAQNLVNDEISKSGADINNINSRAFLKEEYGLVMARDGVKGGLPSLMFLKENEIQGGLPNFNVWQKDDGFEVLDREHNVLETYEYSEEGLKDAVEFVREKMKG